MNETCKQSLLWKCKALRWEVNPKPLARQTWNLFVRLTGWHQFSEKPTVLFQTRHAGRMIVITKKLSHFCQNVWKYKLKTLLRRLKILLRWVLIQLWDEWPKCSVTKMSQQEVTKMFQRKNRIQMQVQLFYIKKLWTTNETELGYCSLFLRLSSQLVMFLAMSAMTVVITLIAVWKPHDLWNKYKLLMVLFK